MEALRARRHTGAGHRSDRQHTRKRVEAQERSSGANHYYIHAVEASRSPERAVDSAKRLETLVPGAGHLVHMPAHIYQRVGDYRAAAKSNAIAATVDEKYVQATGAKGMYPTMYYGHNLQFRSAAAMMAGNFAEAREAGKKTAELWHRWPAR